MNEQPVYFISGLGIDERAFVRIRLPEGFTMRFVQWIEPLEDEPLRDYCKRLSAQITGEGPFILAGMSYGGVVANELNRILPVKKIILFSSMASSDELPRLYRALGLFRVHRFIPTAVVKRTHALVFWLFGTKTPDEKKLLTEVMRDIPDTFLRWAAERTINWKLNGRQENVVRIHGTQDRVLYFPESGVDYPVEGAGHFMVYTHAEEVNRALEKILTEDNGSLQH